MLRIRKLVLAMAAASALSSGMANALGLGELTLKSAQNQPLDAEIELLDVRDLKAAEVAPSLAPPEEFSKAGVAFPTYLEDLTFTPVINPNGKSVLRVTSSQPLPGPVVKFLVQVMWPQGACCVTTACCSTRPRRKATSRRRAMSHRPQPVPATTPPSAAIPCGKLLHATPRVARSSRP